MSEFDPRSTTDRKDNELDGIIRPQQLDDFTGQKEIVSNLEIYIKAAKMRGEALDHTLFHGPPGLGKTTLAHIIANEMGVNMKVTSGPVLDKPGDLAGLLTSLERETSFSSTRSTASPPKWKNIYIPRWRTMSSTS